MKISRAEAALDYVILSVFALFSVLPLIGVVFSSLMPPKQNDGGFHIPTKLAFSNYSQAWQTGHFSRYMANSVLVTVAVLLLTVVLSTMAGFAFARLDFPGSNVLFFILLIGLLLPEEAFIIPLYFDLRGAKLTDTYWGLIFPQTAQSVGFGVYWMRSHFRGYPGEIIEAAKLDGASQRRLLWQVLVPSSWSPIATMCVLVGMWTWNEFLIPLVVANSDDGHRTAPLGLAFFQGQHTTQFSLMAAAGVLIALPIVIAYVVLQRRFINGVAGASALK